MLGGAWKACSASLGFSAPLSSLLSAERSLLIVHLAQAGSHGLKLTRVDVVDGGMVREADRLIFFVAEQTAFELAGDRHFPSLHLIPLDRHIVRAAPLRRRVVDVGPPAIYYTSSNLSDWGRTNPVDEASGELKLRGYIFGRHHQSHLCNWSRCPIVAEKWCNLYAINYSALQTWIEIAHRPLIEINDATRR